MAAINYKNFTLNTPGDAGAWGATEQTAFKNIVDTMLGDCNTKLKDTANGHRHHRVYDTGGNVMLRGVSAGVMRLEYDASNYLQTTIYSDGDVSMRPGGGFLTITGAGNTPNVNHAVLNIDSNTGAQLCLYNNSFYYATMTANSNGDLRFEPMSHRAYILGAPDAVDSQVLFDIINTDGDDGDVCGIRFGFADGSKTKVGIFVEKFGADYGAADMLFCINNTADNATLVTKSDARMILTATSRLGLGVLDPDAKMEIMCAVNAQLKLSYDATDNCTFLVDTNGDLTITPSGDEIILPAGKNLAFATSTGTKIGTAASQLIGFYGVAPVDQPATIADPSGGATTDAEARTAINAIIDRLQELGLIA